MSTRQRGSRQLPQGYQPCAPVRAPRACAAAPPGDRLALHTLEPRLLLAAWFVDDSADPGGNGMSAFRAFQTISQALAVTRPGDAVFVLPGTYTENIAITQPILLRGLQGARLTTLAPANGSQPTVIINTGAAATPRLKTTIIGMTIVEGSSGAGLPVEIVDGTQNVVLSNNIIDAAEAADGAIVVQGSAVGLDVVNNDIIFGDIGVDFRQTGTGLNDLVITNNRFQFSADGASGGATAIGVTGATGMSVTGNTFAEPLFVPTASSTTAAMRAVNVADFRFMNNEVNGLARDGFSNGLLVSGVNGASQITGNRFNDLRTGVSVTQGADGVGVSALRIGGANGRGNLFNNTRTGLSITDTGTGAIGDLAIRDNQFRTNTTGIQLGSGSGSADIDAGTIDLARNNFGPATSNAVAIQSFETDQATDVVTIRNCWFGDPSGPTNPDNPGGTGATVNGLFDFDNLGSPAGTSPDLIIAVNDEALRLPTPAVPGDRAVLPVIIPNQGDGAAFSIATVRVFLSTDTALDEAADTLIGTRTGTLFLAPGASRAVSVRVVVGDVPEGTYRVLVDVEQTASGGNVESDLTNNVGLAEQTVTVVRSFGTLPDRVGFTTLIVESPLTGNDVLFRLVGPGTATVDEYFNIAVTGATDRTTVIVRTLRNEPVVLGNVTITGGLGRFIAPSADLQGDFAVTGGILTRLVWLGSITGGDVAISGTVNQLRAGEIIGGGTIAIDTLNVLNVTGQGGVMNPLNGDFQATLVASNGQAAPFGVRLARIRGDAFDGSIRTVNGAIARILVVGALDNFGIFAADDLWVLATSGMRDSALLAGSNAAGTGLTPGTDARIGRILVTGRTTDEEGFSFINSVIGASTVTVARLANVNPTNTGSTSPVDLVPAVASEEGVFVTTGVRAVVANQPGTAFQVFTTTSDSPAIPPDFYVRQIV